jgi:hypothetical protein
VHTLKQLVWLSIVGTLVLVTLASIAEAARNGDGACGEYKYRHNGTCVDARGSDAGPPSHWHSYDPSRSIH